MNVVTAVLFSLLLISQKAPYVAPGAVEGTLRTVEGGPAIAVRVVAYKVTGSGNPDDNLNYFELERPVSFTQTDNDGHYSMMDLPPGMAMQIAQGDANEAGDSAGFFRRRHRKERR